MVGCKFIAPEVFICQWCFMQYGCLSWKLSQDSMLIVTPECFYQGSKVKKT